MGCIKFLVFHLGVHLSSGSVSCDHMVYALCAHLYMFVPFRSRDTDAVEIDSLLFNRFQHMHVYTIHFQHFNFKTILCTCSIEFAKFDGYQTLMDIKFDRNGQLNALIYLDHIKCHPNSYHKCIAKHFHYSSHDDIQDTLCIDRTMDLPSPVGI